MPYDAVIYEANPIVSAQTLASNYTSGSVDIREALNFSIQPIATGSSILGSIQLLASTDNINFGTYGSAITLPAGNLIPVNYPDQGMGWVKVQFTAASGTGSLTVNISTKR